MESFYNERDKSESAGLAAEYIRHFLTDEPIPGIANEYEYASTWLPGITLKEVNQYAQENMPNHSAKLVAYLGSDKVGEVVPDSTQLLSWVNAAETIPVTANHDTAISSHLMAHPPKAGGIVKETEDKQLGLTKLTLSNGVQVILKPTDFKSDQVLLSAARFGGQSLFDDGDKFNARYASAIEYSMGLADFTPTDLQKVLSGKAASVQLNFNDYTESVSGMAASADVETLLQSIFLRFTAPREDPDLFHATISRLQDSSKNKLAKPEVIFSNALLSTLYGNHPRLALAPKPEDFAQIELSRAAKIYRARFGSAKGWTFILVGSFGLEKIKPLIATYLASLPTTQIPLAYRDLQIRPVSGVVKQTVHSGSEAKSQVSLVFTGLTHYSKEENMRFQALIEVMNLRIIDVLREKLTLIYDGGMSGVIDRIPYQNYRLSLNAPCAPDNVDKVIAAVFAEIDKIKQDGPTKEEWDKVKLNWISNYHIALRTNEQWLSYVQEATLFNTDPADILTLEARIQAVTLDEIKQAAQRYLNTENYVQVVLYPADERWQ
jgi:zinc protease